MPILHSQSTGTETKRKRSADDLSEPHLGEAPSGEMSAIPVPGVVVSETLQFFGEHILTPYEQPFELTSKAKGFLTSQNVSKFPAASINDRVEAKRHKVSH